MWSSGAEILLVAREAGRRGATCSAALLVCVLRSGSEHDVPRCGAAQGAPGRQSPGPRHLFSRTAARASSARVRASPGGAASWHISHIIARAIRQHASQAPPAQAVTQPLRLRRHDCYRARALSTATHDFGPAGNAAHKTTCWTCVQLLSLAPARTQSARAGFSSPLTRALSTLSSARAPAPPAFQWRVRPCCVPCPSSPSWPAPRRRASR